jgi:hypothetical protein
MGRFRGKPIGGKIERGGNAEGRIVRDVDAMMELEGMAGNDREVTWGYGENGKGIAGRIATSAG